MPGDGNETPDDLSTVPVVTILGSRNVQVSDFVLYYLAGYLVQATGVGTQLVLNRKVCRKTELTVIIHIWLKYM